MHLTVNKNSALRILRIVRKRAGKRGLTLRRVPLSRPDPSPRARWNGALLEKIASPWDARALDQQRLSICVDCEGHRLGSKLVENTVYREKLPRESFVPLDETLAISCPELLFVELANQLAPSEHLQLGFELCGTFCRDPYDPLGGSVAYNLPALTSVERIGGYLDSCGRVNGKSRARRTLALLADNAWSPMESAIATMVSLPLRENGYGFGRCTLNPRITPSAALSRAAKKASRVPDIMIAGTCVGLNYDGEYHLDLNALVDAAVSFGNEPWSRTRELKLQDVKARVRAQVIDDNRRNRELIADGLIVFPVFKEDLYDEDGFDGTMMQVMQAMQLYGAWEDDGRMELIASEAARKERRELLTSMLPGKTRKVTGGDHEAIVSLKRHVW